jgi:hypothetical protein
MKRLALLSLLALLPTSAALADGCPPTTCGTTSVAPPGSPVLVVRPSGDHGPALGYDVVARRWRFSLPSGVLSADGRIFVSARSSPHSVLTRFARYDIRTGRTLGRWSLGGRWGIAAASPDGERIALLETRRWGIVAGLAARRSLRSRIPLRGNYQVEALSPDGRRLYLVHWRGTRYALEHLDLTTRRISPTRLADPDEKMAGTALSAVGTRDGRWLHTLYIKANGESFVHALDLTEGLGHCIDLPLRGDLMKLSATALTLSPDERRLYLASPLLGRVTTVDLEKLKVSRVTRFHVVPVGEYVFGIGPNVAVSANGRMLAFTSGARLWLYDAAYGAVRGQVSSPSLIQGLGFHPDGRRVLALGMTGRSQAFDAATGRRVG